MQRGAQRESCASLEMVRERTSGGRKEAAIEMREMAVKEFNEVKADAASLTSFTSVATLA